MEQDRIDTCTCDSCGSRRVGVLFHDANEVPVLFECQACNRTAFERVARRDIADWLRGSIDSTSRTFGRAA